MLGKVLRKVRKNDKGFSLVELIVVIAIMAVLIAILAPQFLKYVERSREAKDLTNADEILRAVQTAMENEDVYTNVHDKDKITWSNSGISVTGVNTSAYTQAADHPLVIEIKETLGITNLSQYSNKIVSKSYSGKTYTVTIAYGAAANGGKVLTVKGAWN